jgi:hypothetical protein
VTLGAEMVVAFTKNVLLEKNVPELSVVRLIGLIQGIIVLFVSRNSIVALTSGIVVRFSTSAPKFVKFARVIVPESSMFSLTM